MFQDDSDEQEIDTVLNFMTRAACPDHKMCRSKWGYCGTGHEYCGDGCTAGPCFGGNNGGNGNNGGGGGGGGSIITDQNFACAFNTIDAGTRQSRLNGLRNSGWKPSNKDEAAVFLAHVFHETDGLKTIREYCAPGCGSHYAGSWCSIQGTPAGKALAVKTAVWFYNANNMAGPAKQGDFAATTRIINGALECNRGSGYNNQLTRVATYKRIRHCFGLGEPHRNPVC
ncbi:unnamed protein product [Rotaria sordida]|uniref:Chitin-binding type-1 domain-containing protein n=1 Tax=Rotaria sordida TaxID=392033 RepID=A0A815PBE4_9BILA|nr:unnamed protein product [Rotaria sordida]CAF1446554.1 unnamed protein product [Rotaria sordida]